MEIYLSTERSVIFFMIFSCFFAILAIIMGIPILSVTALVWSRPPKLLPDMCSHKRQKLRPAKFIVLMVRALKGEGFSIDGRNSTQLKLIATTSTGTAAERKKKIGAIFFPRRALNSREHE